MTTTTTELYPPVEPYATGRLEVGDGHSLYFEEVGNPEGKPAVFIHGGPGGGLVPDYRRFFDPERYRVVLYDQRGCGRSAPHASAPGADLSGNTTWALVADLERLRVERGIPRWQVFGGSWGSALALAYAQAHPRAVTELVLRGIFTLRRSELDWYYNGGAANLAPQWWERFERPLLRHFGELPPGFDRIAGYHDLLFDPDPAVHRPAGVAWTTWEAATSTLEFSQALVDEFSDPDFALAFARIENHFFVHGGWWRADYASPEGVQFNALFGHSANQEIVHASPAVGLDVGDQVFLRPQISESVLLEFGDLLAVRGGRIVDAWPVYTQPG